MSARCFSFCGPGFPLDGHFAVGKFIRDALYGNTITVQGDGTPKRSYLHEADLAMWLLYLLTKGHSGTSYNVGSDEVVSIKQLAIRVRDLLAPNAAIKVLQASVPTKSRDMNYVPMISRARSLGCRPWTSLSDSTALTGNFYRTPA